MNRFFASLLLIIFCSCHCVKEKEPFVVEVEPIPSMKGGYLVGQANGKTKIRYRHLEEVKNATMQADLIIFMGKFRSEDKNKIRSIFPSEKNIEFQGNGINPNLLDKYSLRSGSLDQVMTP